MKKYQITARSHTTGSKKNYIMTMDEINKTRVTHPAGMFDMRSIKIPFEFNKLNER